MDNRFQTFSDKEVKNITGYNDMIEKYNKKHPESPQSKMPYIVVIIDELAEKDGFAASLLGENHSLFGKIIFFKYPSIKVNYYIDPIQSISAEHIQEAAEAAGIPPDKIDEAVRSLSAHMGWDITKGSLDGKL